MYLPIIDNGVRPAGEPDKCFYCGAKVLDGGEVKHVTECVLLHKTVVLQMTINYVVSVPRHWDKYNVESHRNDTSWCTNNEINSLKEWAEKGNCYCMHADIKFIREATVADHQTLPVIGTRWSSKEGKEVDVGP
jgi:hypothetical protein